MFTIEERDRVRDWVLAKAEADLRITAGAVVGSMALGDGDRWSDLDLTFAVDESATVQEMLDDWTPEIQHEFAAAQLFDLPAGTTVYRVFLIPGCLQFDLSFTPATDFGPRGPKFRLLFGEAAETEHSPPPRAETMFGYAVHHAVRAHFCIRRGRTWQAEYWLSEVRDLALGLACRRRDLPASHGRGFDDLPDEVRASFEDAFARSLEPEELQRALGRAIDGLLREADEVGELVRRVEPDLRALIADRTGEGSTEPIKEE